MAHGFLALRSLEGTPLADGDLIQTSSGKRVTTRLVFRFKDGSIREETSVYTQRKVFRLLSNHVVQRGPSFKLPLESTIDAVSGEIHVRYTDEDGKEKVIDERLDLPMDLANGLNLALLKNISPKTPKTTVSMLAITPEPRLVELEYTPVGEEPFSTAGTSRKATHYAIKVHVPGVTGAIASVLGKVPPDSHVWILGGEAPTFVKAEASLSASTPVWRIDLVSPVWPSDSMSSETKERKGEQPATRRDRPVPSARSQKRAPRSGMK